MATPLFSPSGRRSARVGREVCRAPHPVTDPEPLEIDGLQDHDGWSERSVTGMAVAVDAEHVTFGRSTIIGVRFTGSHLRRLELVDVSLTNCDLAGVVLEEASFNRVALVNCRLNGADLGGAQLTDVRFTDCQLEEAALRMVRTERLVVSGGSAQRIDLYRARITASRWHDVDLTGADLSGAEMARARLHGSTLVEVKGGRSLTAVVIDPSQEFMIGRALLADSSITVDEDPG